MNSRRTSNSNRTHFSFFAFSIPILAGFSIGILYLGMPIYCVFLVCAFLCFPLLRAKPELGILAIVALTSSILFEEALPFLPTAIGNFHLVDTILLALLFLIPLNLIIDKKFSLVKTPLDKPLLLFYLAAIIAAYIAISYYGLGLTKTLRKLSTVTYYLLFFGVTNLIRTEKQVRFLARGLFIIGCITGIAMLVQAIIGESMQFMPGRVESASTFDVVYGATRVLPPGQTLIYVIFITSVCLIALNETKLLNPWHYFVAFSTTIGVVLTYNRSYWGSSIISFALLFLFARPRAASRVLRFVLIFLLVLALPFVGIFFSYPSTGIPKTAVAFFDRFGSLFAGKALLESHSLRWRRVENKYAFQQVADHPLVGIGLGNSYRPSVFGPDDNLTWYIHNGYLWIALNFGVIGALPFFWFYLGFIVRGFRNWKKVESDYFRSLVIGITLGGIAILIATMVVPMFMEWYSIVVISIMIGLSEAIIRINERGSQESFSH